MGRSFAAIDAAEQTLPLPCFVNASCLVRSMVGSQLAAFNAADETYPLPALVNKTCVVQSSARVFIDNLLVRFHMIVGMILVDRPCAMGV